MEALSSRHWQWMQLAEAAEAYVEAQAADQSGGRGGTSLSEKYYDTEPQPDDLNLGAGGDLDTKLI